MPITEQQKLAAEAEQRAAAEEMNPHVRLVAGPGTGKSRVIEKRVRWLLSLGAPPDQIFVVSFTRAASLDLRRRIRKYCAEVGQADSERVSVTTLHSLALRALRQANLLELYPADPLVLDEWELKNIFDQEFHVFSNYTPGRCEEVRRAYEAYWITNSWNPFNYIPPDPPISDEEKELFARFHLRRTETYSCVLPGEIVRKCVDNMAAGLFNAHTALNIQYLIVDEYQDLNESDIRFIDLMVENGVNVFIAGDDDQSIYSFRFALPSGIQSFTAKYPDTAQHELGDCFRCTTQILETAKTLINRFAIQNRIPKTLKSLYEDAVPPEAGVVHRWKFSNDQVEANAIAQSCKLLIENGVPPRDILILIANQKVLLGTLEDAFKRQGLPYELPHTDSFIDSDVGRFILGLLRVVCDPNDYVAHRVILGQLSQVGAGTCNAIAQAVIDSNINFRNIFYGSLPDGVFQKRSLNALERARAICAQISRWQKTDTFAQRREEISKIICDTFDQVRTDAWITEVQHLPPEMTLNELRDYLWTDNDEQMESLLEQVYDRLDLEKPVEGFLPPKVRLMTMHGAKGLDAQVVFIPGLEEGILPRSKQQPYPGLVLEAARMLYVSITRARAACILTYAKNRVKYGKYGEQTPSRFALHLGG